MQTNGNFSGITQLFDRIYTHYVLRDFVGKAIPGMIMIMSIVTLFIPFADVMSWLKDVSNYFGQSLIYSLLFGLILFSVFWVSGLISQSLGEFSHLLVYALEDDKKFKKTTYIKIITKLCPRIKRSEISIDSLYKETI